tara:strand:+ start:1142 stop:1261 length:120 start_codon:yes stop_codon:yes gene_type:complete
MFELFLLSIFISIIAVYYLEKFDKNTVKQEKENKTDYKG